MPERFFTKIWITIDLADLGKRDGKHGRAETGREVGQSHERSEPASGLSWAQFINGDIGAEEAVE
jgi:hypothetical protein